MRTSLQTENPQHLLPAPAWLAPAPRGSGPSSPGGRADPKPAKQMARMRAAKRPCKYMSCLEDTVLITEYLAGWLCVFCRQGNAQLLIHIILL